MGSACIAQGIWRLGMRGVRWIEELKRWEAHYPGQAVHLFERREDAEWQRKTWEFYFGKSNVDPLPRPLAAGKGVRFLGREGWEAAAPGKRRVFRTEAEARAQRDAWAAEVEVERRKPLLPQDARLAEVPTTGVSFERTTKRWKATFPGQPQRRFKTLSEAIACRQAWEAEFGKPRKRDQI